MTAATSLFTDIAIEQVVYSLMRLPDPDLVLQKLGMGRHELRKLETDDEISAAMETRREAVVATPWRLEPYDSEPVQWLLATIDPHMERILRGAWSAVPYGYSVLEVVYSKGSRIGLARAQEKPLEWFGPQRDGTLLYTPTLGAGSGSPEPVDTQFKMLLTIRNPTYRNPYGEALLSRVYWPWFFRQNGWRFWMQYLERFSDPLLLGKVHDPADWLEKMQQLGYTNLAATGKDESLEAVTQAASNEFEKVEMALGRRIQKLILGQTLTSEIGDKGSYAAAQVHNQVRDDKRRADIRLITPTVQRLCDALWTLNGFPAPAPTFVMQDETGLEIARAQRDATLLPVLSASGMTLSPDYYLDVYDYESSHLMAGQPTKTTGAAPSALSLDHAGEGGAVFLGATKPLPFTPEQMAIERLAEAALAKASQPISEQAIRSAILGATSPEDLETRLALVLKEADTGEFRRQLERGLFACDIMGYAHAGGR